MTNDSVPPIPTADDDKFDEHVGNGKWTMDNDQSPID